MAVVVKAEVVEAIMAEEAVAEAARNAGEVPREEVRLTRSTSIPNVVMILLEGSTLVITGADFGPF